MILMEDGVELSKKEGKKALGIFKSFDGFSSLNHLNCSGIKGIIQQKWNVKRFHFFRIRPHILIKERKGKDSSIFHVLKGKS